MTGLNPSSANGARPRPALLVAGLDPAADEAVRPVAERDGMRRGADLGAAERAAAEFLAALGIDLDREERRATPARMARAYAELLAAQPFRLTTFPNDEGYDELVLARAIPFRTLCEHHMLLFSGVAHVGYLPGERILGLSKLARLVAHFAARPQTQERLTMQVARCLEANLRPRGAGVVLEAGHTCMTQRGIRAHGATTVTSALLGALRTDPRSRAEFFALARVPAAPEPA
jgi:GTP cyclohydrolase I